MSRHLQLIFISLLIFILMPCNFLQAQKVELNIFIDPNPPFMVYAWQNNIELLRIDAFNAESDIIFVRLSGAAYGSNGEVIAEVNDFNSPVIPLQPGSNTMYPIDLLTGSSINFSYGETGEMVRTSRLPEDEYTICAQFLEAETFEPISERICTNFFIQGLEPPFLTYPENGHTFEGETYFDALFKWTPVQSVNFMDELQYRFVLTEVIEGQSPMEALMMNAPIYETFTIDYFLIWPIDLHLPRPNQMYTWAVQIVGIDPNFLSPEEGWSEPYEFKYNEIDIESTDSLSIAEGGFEGTDFTDTDNPDDLSWLDGTGTNGGEDSGSNFETTGSNEEASVDSTSIGTNNVDDNTVMNGESTEVNDTTSTVDNAGEEVDETEDGDDVNTGIGIDGETVEVDSAGADNAIDTLIYDDETPPTIINEDDSTQASTGTGYELDTIKPILPGTPIDESDSISTIPGKKTKPPVYPPGDPRYPRDDSITYRLTTDCKQLPLRREYGREIKVGVKVDAIKKYPYPRAVPIRVEAKDLDYAIFECTGCNDGKSSFYNVMEDLADDIKWELDGYGSLNVPFSAAPIDSVEQQIDSIENRQEEIQDSLEWLSNQIDKLPDKISDMDTSIERQTDAANRADSIVAAMRDSKKTEIDSLRSISENIESAQKIYKEKTDSLIELRKEIDSIHHFLEGKPTGEMLGILEEIENHRENIEEQKDQIKQIDEEILEATEEGTQNIKEADSLLNLGVLAYNQLKDNSIKVSDQIIEIENRMYAGVGTSAYFKARRNWDQSIYNLINLYYDENISSKIAAKQNQCNRLSYSVFTTRNSSMRSTNLRNFKAAIDSLQYLATNSCSGSSECRQDANESKNKAQIYTQIVDRLASTNFFIDLSSSARIDSLRNLLKEQESAIQEAKTEVESLNQNYLDAISDYQEELQELESEKKATQEQINTANNTLSTLEQSYHKKEIHLKDSINKQRPVSLNEIASKQNQTNTINEALSHYGDSIQSLKTDSIDKSVEIANLTRDIQQAASDSTSQHRILENYQKLKKNYEDKLEKFENRKEELEKEQEELNEKLEEAKKQKKHNLAGNKKAKGQIVYYIPPPLEEIMKDKPKFERLKQKVALHKDSLDMAYKNKAMAQQRIAKLIEKIGKKMAKHHELTQLIDSLNEAKQNAELELSQSKNSVAKQYQDKQQELQDKHHAADSLLNKAKNKQTELETKKEELTVQIESLDQLVTQRDTSVNQLIRGIQTQDKDIENKENEIKTIQEQINTINDELALLRNELIGLENEKGRENNNLTRAYAANNKNLQTQSKAAITQLETQITTKKANIKSKEQALNPLVTNIKTKQKAVESLAETNVRKRKELQGERLIQRAMRDSLFALYDQYKQTLEKKNYWKNIEIESENQKEKINDAREAFQEVVSDSVSNNDEVKSKQAAFDQIEATISDASNDKDAIVTYINEQIPKKDEIIEEAESRLETAKQNLEQAEQELDAFINEEFNNVDFEAELIITVDDRPLDALRYDDEKVEKRKFIKYQQSRIPEFENEEVDSKLSPKTTEANCATIGGADPLAPPEDGDGLSHGQEPRTIALLYENGKRLWPAWPVFNSGGLLQYDVVEGRTNFKADSDKLIHICSPSDDCTGPKPKNYFPIDPGDHSWGIEGLIGHYKLFDKIVWEPNEVPKDKLQREINVSAEYKANKIAPDKTAKDKGIFIVKPGVLLEVPDTIFGIPEEIKELIGRTVQGDHKAISSEDIEFSLEKIAGDASDYGINGKDSLATVKTDENGYAKVNFNFGKGFARFIVHVKWLRKEQIVEQKQIIVESPIRLQFLRFGVGPNKDQWEKALELVNSGETVTNSSLETFAQNIDTSTKDDSTGAMNVHALVGLLDYEYNFVEEEKVIFTPPDKVEVDPKEAESADFGIARTEVSNLPDSTKITLIASVEDKYKEVGKPDEDKLQFSTEKLESFMIGPEGEEEMFTINLEEAVSPGETINQMGSFATEGLLSWLVELAEIELRVNDVELEDGIAVSGSVSYTSETGLSVKIPGGFEVKIDSVAIEAGAGLGVGGTFTHSDLEGPIGFNAKVDKEGNFLGTVNALPDIEVAGFKLKEGSSFTLDMSTAETPIPTLESRWKGLVINSCILQLPEVFNGNEGTTPTTVSATNLYIGTSGIGGEVAIEGAFLNIEYAGYGFDVNKVAVNFTNSEINSAEIAGDISLGVPFEGKLNTSVTFGDEEWVAKVSTESPLSIPRIGTTFSLLSETGIYYSTQEDLYTFRLSATANTDRVGEVTIDGLKIDSEGRFEAKNISIGKAVEFGSGFNLHLDSLSFKYDDGEINLRTVGGFGFEAIGIDKLDGVVTVSPGPLVNVELTGGEISFSHGPIDFKGSFEYASEEFKGMFSIEMEKLKPLRGISGLIIVGNQAVSEEETFNYWYAEMILKAAVPIAQTGISLLELGGGVGYNYRPPMGALAGSPSHNSGFAFKGIVAIGNTPTGELVKGRLEMVLMQDFFSLYGKLWLLQKEESMYGDGSISLYWNNPPKVEGHVGMFVGIPDADGDIFYFRGRVNYLYSQRDKYIRSEVIRGAFMKKLNAEARIDVDNTKIDLGGRLYYNLDKKYDVGIAYVVAVINVDAGGTFLYHHKQQHLNTKVWFEGDWDIDIETRVGDFDVIAGEVELRLELDVKPRVMKVDGKANVTWDTWIHSGSKRLDVGFTYNY